MAFKMTGLVAGLSLPFAFCLQNSVFFEVEPRGFEPPDLRRAPAARLFAAAFW
jgi:hypothetical protein